MRFPLLCVLAAAALAALWLAGPLPVADARTSPGQRIVSIARGELAKGVREIPDGSNRHPRIRLYVRSTRPSWYGAPWCAYFVSWVTRRAGRPIGPAGRGLGYVPYIRAWAKRTGRWRARPRPGYLITFPQHVGIVETVGRGRLTTIEGNASNAVRRRWRRWGEASGYVALAAPAPNRPVRAPTAPPRRRPERLQARINAYPGLRVGLNDRVDLTANESTGDFTRAKWDLDGDGRWDRRGTEASRSWTTPGIKTVRLRIERGRRSSTATARITVIGRPPRALVKVTPPQPRAGDAVRFDASASRDADGHVERFEWDLDGDGTSERGGPVVEHAFAAAGAHPVRLRAIDDDGLVAERIVTVWVREARRPSAKAACATTTPASGQAVRCSGTGSRAYDGATIRDHEWDVDGDGAFDQSGPAQTLSWARSGEARVVLRVTDSRGQQAEHALPIRVRNRPPIAALVAPASAAPGLAVGLDGSGSADPDGGLAGYEWDLDGNGTTDATGPTVTHSWPTTGDRRVRLRVRDDQGATATAYRTVRVRNGAPTARLDAPVGVPAGEPARLDASASSDPDGHALSFAWSFSDGQAGGLTGPVAERSFAKPGRYTVTVKVADGFGASHSTSATVFAADPATAGPVAQLALPARAAVGEYVRLDASESADPDGTIREYRWDLDGDGRVDRVTTSAATTHRWTQASSVQPTVTVVDSGWATATAAAVITIGSP